MLVVPQPLSIYEIFFTGNNPHYYIGDHNDVIVLDIQEMLKLMPGFGLWLMNPLWNAVGKMSTFRSGFNVLLRPINQTMQITASVISF